MKALHDAAVKILAMPEVRDPLAQQGLAFGHLLGAADLAIHGATEVAVVGDPSAADFRALTAEVARQYLPALVMAGLALAVRFVPYSDDHGNFDPAWTALMVAFALIGAMVGQSHLVRPSLVLIALSVGLVNVPLSIPVGRAMTWALGSSSDVAAGLGRVEQGVAVRRAAGDQRCGRGLSRLPPARGLARGGGPDQLRPSDGNGPQRGSGPPGRGPG